MENEFINTPLLVSVSRDPKGEQIRTLEQKNGKLKTEIMKIQQVLQEKEQEEHEGHEEPKKRESLFVTEDNMEILSKELANTYKRIKMYEYEIKRLQESSQESNVTQRAIQIDQILREKQQVSEKLKATLAREQKVFQENSRRLANHSEKEEIEKQMRMAAEECKYLKDKVREFETKEELKKASMKKQQDFIRKLETTLLESGIAAGEFDEMKQRAVRSLKRTVESTENEGASQMKEDSEGEEDGKTYQHYQQLLSEISVLDKLLTDYERQFEVADKERQDAAQANLHSRNKILQVEDEIQKVQRDIFESKNRMPPINTHPLKPLRAKSVQQVEQTTKILPLNLSSKMIPSKKVKTIVHLLRHDEVGMATETGQRFTDRNILGKTNLSARITGIKVYIDKERNVICGLQCSYDGFKKGGEYVKKEKDAREKAYLEEEFICKEKSYIRNIDGTLNGADHLECLSVIASDGSQHRFGQAKTTRRSFSLQLGENEFPTCVFGTLAIIKDVGRRERSEIEHLGFEIGKEEGSHVNEFSE